MLDHKDRVERLGSTRNDRTIEKVDAHYHSFRRQQQGASRFGRARAGAASGVAGGRSLVLGRRDAVMTCDPDALSNHARPFEDRVRSWPSPASQLERRWTGRRPRAACWCSAFTAAGRKMANCRRCAKCAAFPSPGRARRRLILPSTRSRPSGSWRLAGVMTPAHIVLENIDAALRRTRQADCKTCV